MMGEREVRESVLAGWGRSGSSRSGAGRATGVRSTGSGGSGLAGEATFEATEADQVVGGGHEVARQAGALDAPETGPSEAADGLHPAEDLLDAFPDPLADGIAGVAGGPAVDGAPPPARVLGDVRGDAARADVGDAVAGVVVLVAAERPRAEAPVPRLPQQLWGHIPLGCSARLGDLEVDQQAMPVLHQGVPHEGQL